MACLTETQETVLNVSILAQTAVSRKSDDFLELVVPDEGIWGMYFPSPADAVSTLDVIERVVAELKDEVAEVSEAAKATEAAPIRRPPMVVAFAAGALAGAAAVIIMMRHR